MYKLIAALFIALAAQRIAAEDIPGGNFCEWHCFILWSLIMKILTMLFSGADFGGPIGVSI